MSVRVACYAGHRGEEEPRVFWLEGRRIEVMAILERWLSPGQRGFRVQAYDARVYVLRHDEAADEWEVSLVG